MTAFPILRRNVPAVPTEPAPASWRWLCPPDATLLPAAAGAAAVRVLPLGSPVVLVDQRLGSRRRLRRLAARAGVSIERELIVLPTLTRSVVVLDDAPEPVWHFWRHVATVPPGLVLLALPARLAVRIGRLAPWSWTGLAPAHVVVGRRQ